MATVGQALTAPEAGWRRLDSTNQNISIVGSVTTDANSSAYGGSYLTAHSTLGIGNAIQFNFTGTKLRIIGYGGSQYSQNIALIIDDTLYTVSQYSATSIYMNLNFDNSSFSASEHSVIMYNNSIVAAFSLLDAIDIDSTGYLRPYNENPKQLICSKVADMTTGDLIPCMYTATSGVAGTFSQLGTCVAAEIPYAGAVAPNGLFFFIKADTGKLIADRVLQTSISWDTLNGGKYIEQCFSMGDVSLLHFDSNILDNSGKVWTAYNGATTSTVQSKFGGSSLSLNGTNQYLITPCTTDFIFGTGDFTIDCWVYLNTLPTTFGVILDNYVNSSTNSTQLIISHTGILDFWVGGSSYVSTTALNINVWNHIAIVRYSGTLFIFINGIQVYSGSSVLNIVQGTANIAIGCQQISGTTYYFPGYIDEFRVSKGIARWTANFTPPISASRLEQYYARSLSGGCAYLGTDGKSSLTDKSLGAWPPTNEWDTYVVNSNLNHKITAGDDKVWHYSSIYSWCQETAITGTWTDEHSNTAIANNTTRTLRGDTSRSSWDNVNWSQTNSSGFTGVILAFRPVLEYIDNAKSTNLFY